MPKLDLQLVVPRCPHCSIAKPRLARVGQQMHTHDFSGENSRRWSVYHCTTCGGLILAGSADDHFLEVTEQYPQSETFDSDAVPERAREYLNQAMESLHAAAGAIMLAASSVDAMLKAKGLAAGSLYSRIDKAASDNMITKDMSKWAHEVRLDANDQRHADENAALPTQDDAKRVIEFVKALALLMFVLPSRVRAGLDEAKKAYKAEKKTHKRAKKSSDPEAGS
jgi:hypothetical protein